MKKEGQKTIYIIETHSGTIPSRVIKKVTRYPFSHIMISLDNKLDKMYTFGRRSVRNPFNSGFIIESTNSKFFKKFNDTECKIYSLKISKKKYKLLKGLIINFEKNPSIYNYDIVGLCLRLFRITIRRKNHYVCSSFVAELIDKTKIYKFNKPSFKVRPSDFQYIPNKELYYSGKLINYVNPYN